MKAHVIENGKVVNTIIVESLNELPNLVSGVIGGIGWSYADGTLTPPVAPTAEVRVPTEIRMAQCRAQLIIDGKDDDVELLLNGIPDPIQQKLYRSFWEYEPIVTRANAMINEMAPLLGIDLDEFFTEASKVVTG